MNKRYCPVDCEVKAVNEGAREVLHQISSASVDRAGDVVEPSGAQIDNFLKNPVVVVDHQYNVESVIGKAIDIRVEKTGLSARTRYLDTPLADAAFRLAQAGIGGWSIGFRPLSFKPIEEKGQLKGFRFTEWELLEYSAVAIPMNQDIVNNSVVRSLDPTAIRKLFTGEPPTASEPAMGDEVDPVPDLSPIEVAMHDALKALTYGEATREMAEVVRRLKCQKT